VGQPQLAVTKCDRKLSSGETSKLPALDTKGIGLMRVDSLQFMARRSEGH